MNWMSRPFVILLWLFRTRPIDALIGKCELALRQTGHASLIVAGGVSANKVLRERLNSLAQSHNVQIYIPSLQLCTDNGAMIAYVGYLRLKSGEQEDLSYSVRPRWSLEELPSVKDNHSQQAGSS